MVVVYDVCRNRRRGRLHRALRKLLPHVQKSVFEGPLADSELPQVRDAIGRTIDGRRDTVRVYRLCAACLARTELFGTSERVPDEPEDRFVE